MALNSISTGYLASLFGGGLPPLSAASGPASGKIDRTPTAPWLSGARTEPSALVRAALAGRPIIDLGAPVIDARGAAPDYRRLFALHQGLAVLSALTDRADQKGVTGAEQARLEKALQSGVKEIGAFLAKDDFESLRVARSAASAQLKSTVGPTRPTHTYVTGPIHDGPPSEPVPALAGDVRFTITITRLTGDTVIDIDLAEMGATPRSLGQVASFINGKLEAAGVETRFGTQVIPGEPRTLKVGGRTLTLPSDNDRWALTVKGLSIETLRFSAADRSDAVFLAQASGKDGTLAVAKFQADTGVVGQGAPAVPQSGDLWVQDRALTAELSKGLDLVRATAAGPDGSLWLLGEADAAVDGQILKGRRDVVLQKLDSAGRIVFTRTLGAATESAAGGLAVGADGRVAVVGSVTGALDEGAAGADARLSDSFVTVFDAEGAELWTQRRGARAEDEASSVAFAADGSLHVTGRARSAMSGAASLGGWDGYLQTFTASGQLVATNQFGSAGDDSAARVAVDGTALVVAGVEMGRLVLRRFDLSDPLAPVQLATRDLGVLQGSVASVAIDGARVLIAGTTASAALADGAQANAHSGGKDAFVARLDLGLTADPADRITFLGGAGDDTGVAAAVSGGKVWLTGQTGVTGAGESAQGRLLRLDADTGQIEWERTVLGEGGVVRPSALAVSAGGASALDRLGLPQGVVDFTPSKRVVDSTAARAGDQFFIDLGAGRMRTVTIAADETFDSLAKKIVAASQNRLNVQVLPSDGRDSLRISLRSGRQPVEILAGTLGRDALEALGLGPALMHPQGGLDDDRPIYALKLPGDLTIADKAGIKAAKDAIQAANLQIMAAYRKLTQLDDPLAAAMAGATYSEYQSKQIANYQAALLKLGGG